MTTRTTDPKTQKKKKDDAANDDGADNATRRFERRLPHEPEKVWRALTEKKELAAWFPTKVANDIVPPSPALRSSPAKLSSPSLKRETMKFEERDTGEKIEGEVIESVPPHRLTYTMGRERLQFDLSRDPQGGCLLVLTVRDEPANQSNVFKCAA